MNSKNIMARIYKFIDEITTDKEGEKINFFKYMTAADDYGHYYSTAHPSMINITAMLLSDFSAFI